MYILFFLLIPAIIAILACKTNKYLYKALQTVACILIVTILGIYFNSGVYLYLAIAFTASVIGDYFLSFKDNSKNFFIYGIALYFLAHVGYLLYIIMSFEVNRVVFTIMFGVLLTIYLIYYLVVLRKSISGIMNIAALFYLIISCVVLATAVSAETNVLGKVIMISGVALIVISDTIIAETDFLNHKKFSFLILPTYYAAQILLCASFIILNLA